MLKATYHHIAQCFSGTSEELDEMGIFASTTCTNKFHSLIVTFLYNVFKR
ncbi:hypothetical protein HUB94_14450 [Paenibacillus cellulosilyticus]|nr:hypothetical protein HUB94_14450 [Paenibacillus cellulosilyticus]